MGSTILVETAERNINTKPVENGKYENETTDATSDQIW